MGRRPPEPSHRGGLRREPARRLPDHERLAQARQEGEHGDELRQERGRVRFHEVPLGRDGPRIELSRRSRRHHAGPCQARYPRCDEFRDLGRGLLLPGRTRQDRNDGQYRAGSRPSSTPPPVPRPPKTKTRGPPTASASSTRSVPATSTRRSTWRRWTAGPSSRGGVS